MIKTLNNIRDISVIDQNAEQNLYSFSELSFDENEVGSGGFGTVHKVHSLDGRQTDEYLLKIFTNEEKKQHAYEVIKLLHQKLKIRQTKTGLPVFHEFPELLGLPFMAFKAYDKISDRTYHAFLMYDLTKSGFEFFGNDDIKSGTYINLDIENKFYLAYQLAKIIDFLHKINFIHSDINEQSIFIHPERIQLALIDFDSGYHFDKQDKPSTFGKLSHWISGKLRKHLSGNENHETTLEDRIWEENWLLANGLFHILFGVIPYFFLNDADDETKKYYLKKSKWPNVLPESDLINKSSIPFLQNLIPVLEKLEQSGADKIVNGFRTVFNEGYEKEKKRHGPGQWKEWLFEFNKHLQNSPTLEEYNANKDYILKKDETVQFTWRASKYQSILLDGKLCAINQITGEVKLKDSAKIKLTIRNDFGEINEIIKVKAKKKKPKILQLYTSTEIRSDIAPVELYWKTKDATKVVITTINQPLSPNGSIELTPTHKSIYVVKAFGLFDQEVEKEIEIDVVKPEILKFLYEINLNEGIDNIDLIWETENTINVTLTPIIGNVSRNGFEHVKIKKRTQFTLTALGLFDKTEATIEAFPFPAPIIEHLLVETPKIELQSILTNNLIDFPFSELELNKIDFSNIINFEKGNLDQGFLLKELIPPTFEEENSLLVKYSEEELSFVDIYKQIKLKIYSTFK